MREMEENYSLIEKSMPFRSRREACDYVNLVGKIRWSFKFIERNLSVWPKLEDFVREYSDPNRRYMAELYLIQDNYKKANVKSQYLDAEVLCAIKRMFIIIKYASMMTAEIYSKIGINCEIIWYEDREELMTKEEAEDPNRKLRILGLPIEWHRLEMPVVNTYTTQK